MEPTQSAKTKQSPNHGGRGFRVIRLKFERTNQKLSQTHVGIAARIPQPEVSQIERGRLTPTPEQLQRLAAVFGVKPDDLLRDVAMLEAR